MSMFERKSIQSLSRELSQVAMGTIPADTVIINAQLINVNTAEILPNISVACYKGRIAYVGHDANHCIGENTKVHDIENKYLAPGFLDGHIHVESSMISVHEYAKAVVPHGTTGIFMDPHEIGNVLGLKGVKLMAEEGKHLPIDIFGVVPSCVPAVPGFEFTGASFDVDDIEKAMQMEEFVGLGEMMNFPGIIYSDENTHKKLEVTYVNNKVATGHYSHPDLDKGLNAYVASGICACHESTTKEDSLARARMGMYSQMREGSAWQDVKETIRAVTENEVDSRFFNLVSDDCHPHTLLNHGHLDYIASRAIAEKLDPVRAIQMVTINCAMCYNKSADIGSVAPSKFADMVVISDLDKVTVDEVFYNGVHVASKGKMLVELNRTEYPDWAKNTVHLPKALTLDDMRIDAPENYSASSIKTRVMQIFEANVMTKHLIEELPVQEGSVRADVTQDIAKMLVFDRHTKSGTRGAGFVKGLQIKRGAVASTVAHDAHNLMVVGVNDEDMLLAAQTLADCGGGMVAVLDKKVIALNPLEIAGLMSEDSVHVVAERVAKLDEAWKTLGCDLQSPFMTMALLPLACLPELRLTNCGLVDTLEFKFVELFV